MTIPSPSKSRVLIVDDEATIRQFMIEVLSRFDFSPVPASDAAEALQILDRETIDLVLLDLHMPGPADGEDLLYLLRDRGDDIPIIIVSGWVDDDATREQPDCVHAVLKKPVAVETLLSTIRRVLEEA
ncbi:MAG: response regulator [Gemmatimonadetes bacterium]|jgi:DNA-binding NtrC family response regulator|nr:response regulator [Gemmatimonadota bacterium]MBT5142609.1 response regulator [Gemmatimonadota bacterium]MBT5592202.1 response regulator [Gemmatimonadota bacterium]MBT5961094.1 response regulator [Gemmatimonadota bacterium]MBT7455771.1 response regulator [Gemmatimonadota bacterium]